MILEELTIRNWRGYREAHSFQFGEGFNLVVGRNEAGKSTLFEALTRVFFDRHTSKTEEIRRIQPLGSSLGPEAVIVFRANGNRYKVEKRFLQQPISVLYCERVGQWERDHEGDRADDELRAILRGETSGRTAKPEQRGLAQALWYLQRDEPIPERAWAEGIKQGLAGLVLLVTRSPDEDRIFRLIEETYAKFYTPTGRPASTSELATLQDQIPQLEHQLSELRIRAEAIERLHTELEELTERKTGKERALDAIQTNLKELKQALDAAAQLEEQLSHMKSTVQEADETLRRYSGDQVSIQRRLKKMGGLRVELEKASEERNRFEADARQDGLAAEGAFQRWKEEYEPGLKKFEEQICQLQAVERLRQLEKQRQRLQDHISKMQKAKKALEAKKNELLDLRAPTKREWTDFQERLSELRVVQAKAEATGIRIRIELQDKHTKITAKPEAERIIETSEFLITAPTSLTLHGIGRIWVRGGGESLAELDEKAKNLRSIIIATLERFGVDDTQALSDLHQKGINLEAEVKELKKHLEDLVEGEVDPERELSRIKHAIEEESVKTKSAPQEWKSLNDLGLAEKIRALNKEKDHLIGEIDEEQKKERKAISNQVKAAKEAQEASNRAVDLQSQIKSLEQENAETLKAYGTLDHLESLVVDAKEKLLSAKRGLDNLMKDYEIKVELPKKLHQQAMDSQQDLEIQVAKIQQEIVDRKARIEEAAAQGLYSQVTDLEAELEAKKRRLASVKRRAEAARLIREMITAYKREQSAALAGPLAELINKWLRLLTEDAYDVLELNEELFPVAVRSSRYGDLLPVESLSYGTHEQVVALVRLAMGILLSKSSGERHLVVIDDRLVNADAIRMKRLCLILQEVALQACQVVVATCNDSPYAGIKGHVIHVPSDGRDSSSNLNL